MAGYNSLKLARTFEIAESAKDSESRKGYQKAMSWALNNKVRHILFYMGDREARNLTDNEQNEKLVKADKIVLHYVRERRVLHKYSPEADFTARDYQAVGNKDFSRRLSTKVVDAQLEKAKQGWWPNNHLPLGYAHQRLRDDNGVELKRGTIVVPDPNDHKVRQVQREFELRAEGHSLDSIRKKILAEGFVGTGKHYGISTIQRRLKNKFYSGKFNWPKHGPEFDGKHELIIDPDIFERVQKSFGNGPRFAYRNKTGIFSGGWLRCADPECGCSVVRDVKTKANGKQYVYWRCSNGRKVHKRTVYVREEKLWEQFGNVMDRINIGDKFASELADAINQAKGQMLDATKRQIRSYQDSLETLEDAETRAYEHLCSDVIDEEGYKREVSRIRRERKRLTKLLEGSQTAIIDVGMESAKSIIELANNAKSLWLSQSPERRLEMLQNILSNPTWDGVSVGYQLKKPFELLCEMRTKKNWRSLRESNPCLRRERALS